MPTGLKASSSPIQISSEIVEVAPNTFVTDQIDLTLNVLDNEVFVVTQLNIDVDAPDSITASTTQVEASISSTRRTSVGNISNQNVLGYANRQIICNAGMTPDGGFVFDREDPLFTSMDIDYLGIIATNNAFLNLNGLGNNQIKAARCRIYGYRATASASLYAALVQSEVLSA